MLKKLCTSRGDCSNSEWLFSFASLFKWELLLKERVCSQREKICSFTSSSFSYWKHFYRIRWPPLNVTIFIMLLRNCVMPRLHLPRSSYDLFVFDFLYDFFGIVGGYKLRRMCLHCLQSPHDFFRQETRTKPYRDLADIVRQPQGYRTTIVLSSWPPYINHTMPARWPCGSRKESVRPLCNCCVNIMCMDLNSFPCSFLHSIWTVFQSHKSQIVLWRG